MKPTDLIQEVNLSAAKSWLEKRGAFGAERAALAKDEEIQQFRVQKMVNDMKMAFNDAVSSGLISKKPAQTTTKPEQGQGQQSQPVAPVNVETMKSSISALTPEDRAALKRSVEERIQTLKTSSAATKGATTK